MAKLKSFEIGVLNVTAHPHSPEIYLSIFREALDLRQQVKVRGASHVAIRGFRGINEDAAGGIVGTFYKFDIIDQDTPWVNLESYLPELDEDGNPVRPVPGHLAPNLRVIPFVFFPNGHRLYYETKHLSPAELARSLYKMFNVSQMRERFGEVNIVTEQTSEQLARILKIEVLSKLEIFINLPNPDDLSGLEARVQERLRRQQARKYREEFTSKDGLLPDEETVATMHVALSNGFVKAEGREDGRRVSESTQNHPVRIKAQYDPRGTNLEQSLISAASSHLPSLTSRK